MLEEAGAMLEAGASEAMLEEAMLEAGALEAGTLEATGAALEAAALEAAAEEELALEEQAAKVITITAPRARAASTFFICKISSFVKNTIFVSPVSHWRQNRPYRLGTMVSIAQVFVGINRLKVTELGTMSKIQEKSVFRIFLFCAATRKIPVTIL